MLLTLMRGYTAIYLSRRRDTGQNILFSFAVRPIIDGFNILANTSQC